MDFDFQKELKAYQMAVEEHLSGYFASELPQNKLFEAMRYSLLAGGKRIRPVLVLEFCRLCGGDWRKALPFAAAVEMIHTYSLIHDDLPCMDDDDYRRGRLTNHKVYGEANAVLAGDGLLTAAFETISKADADPLTKIRIVEALAENAGELGMVGGQILDMEGETRSLTEEEVLTVHRLKTGCLIKAACTMGVIAGRGSEEQLQAAKDYADAIGLAFQIRDDMLDVIGDAAKLGKATQADGRKTTFVTLYGLERCGQLIEEQNACAMGALEQFEGHEFLTHLTQMLANRDF
jgi:geranylgeranyl diphosphate synthase type II